MFVHSSRIQKQVEYLESLHIGVDTLLKHAEIDRPDLFNPEKVFSFEQYHLVLEFALNATHNEFYGLDFGNTPHIGGTIGMMCASCKNLREAFILGCKYFGVQGNYAKLTFIEDRDYARLVYKLSDAWVLQHPETARVDVDAMFAFLVSILKVNSGGTLKPARIQLSIDMPGDPGPYVEVLGLMPEFGQENNELHLNTGHLNIPMKAFNPATFQILRTHIEEQLASLQARESVTRRVRRLLLSETRYQFPDVQTIAGKLNVSARTLQRQLEAENTSFQKILLETRFDLARKLIQKGTLTISEISYTLGYSDLGNFSRSFRKFVGCSPREYKESHCTK